MLKKFSKPKASADQRDYVEITYSDSNIMWLAAEPNVYDSLSNLCKIHDDSSTAKKKMYNFLFEVKPLNLSSKRG